MNRKLKLALVALLGFSTACSTVKNAPRDEASPQTDASARTEKGTEPTTEEPARADRIMLMYGVPSPRPSQETPQPETVPQAPATPETPQAE